MLSAPPNLDKAARDIHRYALQAEKDMSTTVYYIVDVSIASNILYSARREHQIAKEIQFESKNKAK
jgi:hypothetical protein